MSDTAKTAEVLHAIASSRGGGAVHLRRLVAHQAGRGRPVCVAMPAAGELTGEDLRQAGATHLDPGPSGPRWVPWLRRQLADRRPWLMHCHGARAALWARLAVLGRGGRRRPRVVVSLHGLTAPYQAGPKRFAMWAGEQALAGVTDAYVCGSRAEQALAVGFGFPAERLVRIPNGIEPARYGTLERAVARERLGEPEDAFLVLSAARLDRPRDPALLVRVTHRLAPHLPRLRMLLAGDGPLRPGAEALARELGVAAQVRFLGYRSDLPALLGGADAFVHVTRAWEGGVPLAILEAQAAGLPVVGSRAGGIPEALGHGAAGVLVARDDADGLAEALAELAQHPARAAALAEAGRAQVQARYTVARMTEGYDALYTRLA